MGTGTEKQKDKLKFAVSLTLTMGAGLLLLKAIGSSAIFFLLFLGAFIGHRIAKEQGHEALTIVYRSAAIVLIPLCAMAVFNFVSLNKRQTLSHAKASVASEKVDLRDALSASNRIKDYSFTKKHSK